MEVKLLLTTFIKINDRHKRTMPKLIDYPRTNYTGAWELAEIIDDTGGKCAVETAAKKLGRKVSGSFKAIIGSSVKFGLITSKRDLLTTTTLFKRIKHAYDKTEEMQFHREAFLTPPLFTQLYRKFRSKELPVKILDVILIREFRVEEINAQGVAKAFVDGSKMCGIIDERSIIVDIDAISTNRTPRRELINTPLLLEPLSGMDTNSLTNSIQTPVDLPDKNMTVISTGKIYDKSENKKQTVINLFEDTPEQSRPDRPTGQPDNRDAIATLFELNEELPYEFKTKIELPDKTTIIKSSYVSNSATPVNSLPNLYPKAVANTTKDGWLDVTSSTTYQMQMRGPGINTELEIADDNDITIAIALLEKVRRHLRQNT